MSFFASKYRIMPYIVSCTKLEEIGLISLYASTCPVTMERSARFLEAQLDLSSFVPSYFVLSNLGRTRTMFSSTSLTTAGLICLKNVSVHEDSLVL